MCFVYLYTADMCDAVFNVQIAEMKKEILSKNLIYYVGKPSFERPTPDRHMSDKKTERRVTPINS